MALSKITLRPVLAAVPSLVCDAAGIAGAGLVSYGAALVYVPAGYVVGGALLLAGAVLFGRRLNVEAPAS